MQVSWSKSPWAWAAAWSPVFGLNLIVPLVLGHRVLEGRGQAGMYSAVAFYWALGLMACAASPTFGRAMVKGGLITAYAQLAPVLQSAGGFAAVMIVDHAGLKSRDLCGFIDVVITGGLLLMAAYMLGRLCVAIEICATAKGFRL